MSAETPKPPASGLRLAGDASESLLRSPETAGTPDLRHRIASLSPAQRDALARKLSGPGSGTCIPAKRQRRVGSTAEGGPLSFAQERMWILAQFEPNSPIYNRPASLRFRGPLDVPALERSLNEVVRRHEVLRARIHFRDGCLTQTMLAFEPFALPVVGLASSAGESSEDCLQAMAEVEARQSLDLQNQPLWRARLVRVAPEDHALLLTFHHSVFDGWSFAVLWDELAALYRAFRDGQPPALPDLPLPYADFAAWQRERLQGEVLSHQLSYWKEKLAGCAGVLNLPTDRPRPAVQTTRGSCLARRLPAGLTASLKEMSRREGVTLFMTLFGGLAALLQRLTNQEDIVIGVPIAGRTRLETERMIGCFINTLAMRTDVSGNPTVRELLQRVRADSLGAFAHQEMPFERLVKELNLKRDLSRSPLFQVLFQLRNTPRSTVEWPGLQVEPMIVRTNVAKTELSLDVADQAGELTVECEYHAELFEAGTIARLLSHYEVLLCGMAGDPSSRLSELPLLMEAERQQFLVEWNRTERDYPRAKCIHQLFEEQVERTPDAVAVVFEGDSLTYRELNTRANQLGHHLRSLGVGPDVLVGLCLERSLEWIVGLLGILKAGGAYVPMDPSYPTARLSFMLDDARVPVLLTHQELLDPLPRFDGHIVCLDRDWPMIAAQPDTSPPCQATAESLAYVIYTSGSTGTPKGVMVNHANIARLFSATQPWFNFGERDTWTCFHSFAFDFSVWEIWGALIYGGKLIIVPYFVSRSPDAFCELLVAEKVTVLNQTPSAFRQLVQAESAAGAPRELALRYVILGGEALQMQSLKPWFERHGDSHPQLVNMYGITETTVHVTYRPLTKNDVHGPSVIGAPIPDLQVYILDSRRQPVPVGVKGELFVGGAGLARGYLNRPELTAERFTPNPFRSDPEARLYQTGDLGRWLPDGDIEYLGRIDDQVKIRGHRIELGEIEAVLGGHSDLSACVVLAQERGGGDQVLVAFMVGQEQAAISVGSLRQWLGEKLPDYMIPSRFVVLESLPMTPNGKVDRKALEKLDGAGLAADSDYVAPRNERERVLAGIWEAVLHRERVGVYDNFFELGGHSLLAVRMLARLRQAGLAGDIRTLFATPTVAALAAAVGGESGGVEVPPNRIPPACDAITPEMLPLVQLTSAEIARIAAAVPGGAANIQDIYPLAPLQEGILLHHRIATQGDPYLLSAMFSFDSRARVQRYLEALQAVIGRHDILRTAVVWEGLPEPLQVVWRQAPLAVEEVNLATVAGDVAQQLRARFDPRHYRFDVRQAPLLRVFIAHDAANARWLMLHLSHLLWGDHTTQELMAQEIQAHLLGRAAGLPDPLPFRNFVAQARRDVSWEEHEAFFQNMLGEVDEPTTPFGLTDVRGDGLGIAEAGCQIAASLAKRLRERARALRVSAASVFHLAWAQVLARVSGRDQVVFGTVLSGRMQAGARADRVLGLFINTLPIRIRVGDEDAQESVRHTHALLGQLLRHEHAPLALAQRCSKVRAPVPLFSALLNYRHSAATPSDAAEALQAWQGIESLGCEERTNYPLTLAVDDLDEGFALSAQVQVPIDPQRVCAFMHTALEQLVGALESAPATPLRDLEVIPKSERHQLLVEWNRTEREYPREKCTHQLFEEQAERTPGAVAVVFERHSLTYRELNARANQLAHHLRSLGVGPDVLVGLCVERSLEMVVALLGILKAGGAYVPLDPQFPQQRLAFMVQDAAMPVLLTQRRVTERVGRHSARVVCLDEFVWQPELENLTRQGAPRSLAYVIYTSGSTGKPKGVEISHQALVNCLCHFQRSLDLRPHDAWLAITTVSFDIAGLEIWLPLLAGARVIIGTRATAMDGRLLSQALIDNGATILQATPTTWQMLLHSGWQGNPSLQILCGGEAMPQALADCLALLGSRAWNLYGPTETTVYSTTKQLVPDRPVHIGSPLANTQVYVLDARSRPMPVGVPGELCIGGDGVARGYRNCPELTAERFVPDLFSSRLGALLYRTGDLVRWRSDGNLEFLGRLDSQVKIRGFRIELGEIESVLGTHPGVSNCAAVAEQGRAGDKRLAVFLVARDPAALSVGSLRSWLGQKLPDYMIPSGFVLLKTMPLTPNGKVDRKALERMGGVELAAGSESVAPRTELESRLAEIWQTVLGRERVGIRDNFFDLGGHSLLAMRVAARISDALGVDLSLRTLFEFPTIADLAGRLAPLQGATASPVPSLVPVGRTGPLPVSFAQQRLWFLDRFEGKTTAYHMTEALRLRGDLNRDALEQALREIAARHESLRTRFVEVDGQPVQIVDPEPRIAFGLEDLAMLKGEAQENAIIALLRRERESPFDLSRGPLLRMILLKLGPQEHVLSWTVHHIVFDGWSAGVFDRELAALYLAFCERRNAPLEPLVVQYPDYAVWQRRQLEGEGTEHLLAYWTRKLAGAPPFVALPTDRPRTAQQDHPGESRTLDLPPDIAASLSALCQREGATLFMGLLAAFKVLLARYSGQEDILIGTPIAGRDHVATEGLIGFFVNTVVLRTDLSGNPTFLELLKRVRTTVLEAFAHQELPFEKLVEALHPERDPSRPAVVQVLFNMLSFEVESPSFAGLNVERLALEEPQARFDLTFYAAHVGEGLRFRAAYNTDLFDDVHVERMLDQWQHLLRQVAENPSRPIYSYSLRTGQTKRLLPDPAVALAEPHGVPVFRQFLEAAQVSAARSAVRHGGQDWTYQQLEQASKRIAKQLVGGGVRSGDIVAVSGRRSFGLVASILGVLGARGVFLLMDPSLPSARRDLMLQEACARHWVRVDEGRDEEKNWSGAFRGLPTTPISSGGLCLDPRRDGAVENVVLVDAAPSEPAYVFFTSGTSGKPKAILGSHKGLSHFIDWERQILGVLHHDRVAQLTGLSFDVVLRDIFLPLTSGATLCLPGEEMVAVGDRLVPWLRREGITILHAVPSLAQAWLESLPSEPQVPTLRWVLFAGESLTDRLVRQWRKQIGESGGIMNLYGPTETTLAKCFHVVPKNPDVGIQPIGQPLPFTQALVLNQEDQLCGIGEPGEISIRTPFRSLGYLNGSDRDQARFAPNPFRDDPSDLIYRTGDRGVYAKDGTLQILGRCDDQLKIRGARVEPDEISAALADHEGILRSVVMARADSAAETCIVAYIVPVDCRSAPNVDELRDSLKQKLPDYMIPSRFVVVPALPLTPNGKVDRKALEKMDGVELASGNGYAAPRNAREHELVEIWQSVLRRERVGIRDNFFDLGGHSLLAVVTCSQIARRLNVEVPLRWMFDHPTIEGLVKQMESLGKHSQDTRPIEKANREKPLPMSFAQQRMWLLQQTLPDPAMYNQPVAWRLPGRMDREKVRRALQVIVERHEVLRTALVLQGESLVQQVAAANEVALPWLEVNLEAVPPSQKEEALKERLAEEARRPFDLAQAPLWRAVWLKLAEDEQVLAFTFHHSIVDEWSKRLFLQEWERLYAADGRLELAGLPELPVQYADYAAWQRRRLTGELLEQHRSYWREQLRELPPTLELPTEKARPVRPSGRGAVHDFQLTGLVVTRLRELAREEGTTLFTVLLAAFEVWLHRYTGQTDVVVGTPITGRERLEVQALIGFFLNTLPIRVRLDGSHSFRQTVRQVRETLLAAFSHADLPFEQMVELAVKEREAGQQPLYQVMFVLLEEGLPALRLDQAQSRRVPMRTGTSKSDLTLSIQTGDQTWDCQLEYATDLFTAETAARMGRHLTELLRSITEEPEKSISRLNLMSAAERHQVLVEWNQTEREYPRDKCVHQLFEEQVERTPDAVAVVFKGNTLTYRELNGRANQLAHHLRSLGVGPDVLVGLCAERSLEMIVGLLSILKSGGAYISMDPNYPSERLAFMLEDAQTPLLLTQREFAVKFAACDAKVICLDDPHFAELCLRPATNPENQSSPEDLAYAIFTSGSTGQPKGVVVEHRSLANLIAWHNRTYDLKPGDRTTQLASLAFTASVWEIWPTLVAGATVCVVEDAVRVEPSQLVKWLAQEQITVTFMPTPLAEAALTVSWPQNVCLRYLLTGGDQLKSRPPASCSFALVNHYGLTEVTAPATSAVVPPGHQTVGLPPIGRPVSNASVYILDTNLEPVPVGVAGELIIGGAGLARGYLNRPELTAEKFIPDPFSDKPGARLYRTGDFARWQSDGNIEFLGRIDQQVKIRGFRIELGEIESVLCAHPALSSSAVLAQPANLNGMGLTAFIVSKKATTLSLESLRAWLGEKLPDYMIPSRFVSVPALPLSPNGKVDRKALENWDGVELAANAEYLAPRNELERKLAEIWQAVLCRERVGVHDDFFELGGHSLLALAICAQIKRQFGMEVPLRRIFEHPTIERFARRMACNDGQINLRNIDKADRQQPLPMSFAQQGMWLLQQTLPDPATYNLPIAWSFCGQVDRDKVRCALQVIQKRHEVLRTALVQQEGNLAQQVFAVPEVPLPWQEVDLQAVPPSQKQAALEGQLLAEARQPFDLAQAPLWRAVWVKLADDEQVLAFTFQHSIVDEWSLRVFFQELELLYAASGPAELAQLPALPLQYADYAVWQRQRLSGELLERQRSYWSKQLHELPSALELPLDMARPVRPNGRGAVHHFQLRGSMVSKFRQMAREEKTTLFTVLLAAFQVWLHRYTGQTDLVVGTPITGRDSPEVQALIGFFLNTLPIRVRLDGSHSFRQTVRQVRETLLAALSHANLPFEQMVELAVKEREAGQQPLYQVMFVLLEEGLPHSGWIKPKAGVSR